MVYVDDFDTTDSGVALACELAALFGAELTGVSGSVPAMPFIEPYPGGAMVGNGLIERQQLAEDDIKRAEGRFRSVAGARNLRLSWRAGVYDPDEITARHARKADLIILRPDSGWPRMSTAVNPGNVMMDAGRPVLVSPPNVSLKPMLSHVLIAWKDCREARRALADSLPLLARAEKITVLEVSEAAEKPRHYESLQDVADFIDLHGMSATAIAVSPNGQSTADRLLEYALANGIGLVVLGGYGHARAREWIFGGVTHTLLRNSQVSCLFSH